jgi:hypothetical protein
LSVAGHRDLTMSKQSDQFREQAKRAKQWSKAIGNEETSKRLKDLVQQFEEDADRLDRGEKSAKSE